MKWQGGRKIKALADLVLTEYGSTCWLCGGGIDLEASRQSPHGLSLDHVIPRSKGGGDEVGNLRPSHLSCNSSRGARSPRTGRRKRIVNPGWPGL